MGFKGDLTTLSLSDLFQTISTTRKQGLLTVQDKDNTANCKIVYFGKDGISLVSFGEKRKIKLGNLLVGVGKISQEQLDAVLKLQKKSKRKLGEILIEKNLVSNEDICEVVKLQILEEICDLFFWKNATFEFKEGEQIDNDEFREHSITEISLDVNSVLLEALRRIDEWNLIKEKVPSFECTVSLESGFSRGNVINVIEDPIRRRIFDAIDNNKSVYEIATASVSPKVEVAKFLVELATKGYIQIHPAKSKTESFKEIVRTKKKRYWQARILKIAFIIIIIISVVSTIYYFLLKARIIERFLSPNNRVSIKDALKTQFDNRGSNIYPEEDDLIIPLEEGSSKIQSERVDLLYGKSVSEYDAGNLENALYFAKKSRDAAKKQGNKDYLERAEGLINLITNYINESQGLWERAIQLEGEGKFHESCENIKMLIKRYPKSKSAKHSYFPMQISSKPPGATVFKENSYLGRTPLKIRLLPDEVFNIRLEKKGWEGGSFTIKDATVGELSFVLNKVFLWRTSLGGIIETTPLYRNGKLFATSCSQLYVLDVKNGRIVYNFDCDGDIETSPVFSPMQDVLYLGTSSGFLYAVKIGESSCRDLWRLKVGNSVRAAPLVSDDGRVIYSISKEGILYAINSENGVPIWKYDIGVEVRNAPKFYRNILLVGSVDGTIKAVKLDGSGVAWEIKMDGALEGAPVIYGNVFIFGDTNGGVYLFDASSQKNIWKTKIDGRIFSSPVIVNKTIFVSSENGGIYLLDINTGSEIWHSSIDDSIYTWPTVSEGEIFLAGDKGLLYCIDIKDGDIKWTFKAGNKIRSSPCVTEKMIFLGSHDRILYALERN